MPQTKGRTGNPNGRTKGSLNKISKTFKEILNEALLKIQNDPENNILQWAKKNPTEFYKLVSKLLPLQVESEITQTSTIIDYTGEYYSADAQTGTSEKNS